jgi:hypothetical protein
MWAIVMVHEGQRVIGLDRFDEATARSIAFTMTADAMSEGASERYEVEFIGPDFQAIADQHRAMANA